MSAPRRLHCPGLATGELSLPLSAAHHARVLRLEPGAPLVLFDGAGQEADAVLLALDADGARCRVGPLRSAVRRGPRIVLCPMLPKAGKLDDVVRATTELGVIAVHPILGVRSVARPDPARAQKQTERLTAIAREAARQSGRADVPAIAAPARLDDVLARVPAGVQRVFLDPRSARPLAEALAEGPSEEAWLVTGPEGGLAPEEIARLEEEGFVGAGLGPIVLRAETAAVVAVALASHALGGLRP